MGIMSRMLRLCKADVHGVMDQLEDKELLLKQYLREMEASLDHKEQVLRHLTDRINHLNARVSRHDQEEQKVEQDLTVALKKEKDDIARALIRNRRLLANTSRHLNEQIAALTGERNQLKDTLSNQRLQYETLQARANTWCSRTGGPLFADISRSEIGNTDCYEPNDEEIELELIQRKESLSKGDTA